METWNNWVDGVGTGGAYGDILQALGKVTDETKLEEIINNYAYGYSVTAGRQTVAEKATQGGAAGGYVGRMEGGTITNAQAKDLKLAQSFRGSGGFAGEMITGSVAKTGDISLGNLDVVGSLPVVQSFVPVIKNSSTTGYQSGATIKATGSSKNNLVGVSGGFVGRMTGGQIWGTAQSSCETVKLRRVDGTSYVGGFAGKVNPGSVADVDTASNQGLLNQILGKLIASPNDLIQVLNATVSTLRYTKVSSWNDWGIVVNGAYKTENIDNTSYAKAAGGFAGSLSGAVVGKEDEGNSGFTADQIRSVVGGEYVGGGFGIADVDAAAQVSGGGTSNILQLIQAGSVDVLDSFRTYVYESSVAGSKDAGLNISANTSVSSGTGVSLVYSGNAGGFGGSLLDGSVKKSKVSNLSKVTGPNYTGGFIGHSGKSGVVDIDKVNIGSEGSPLNLLGGTLGVLDTFGSNIHQCSVIGKDGGYTVKSSGGEAEVSGGFIGYGDLGRIVDCSAGATNAETAKGNKSYSANGVKSVSSDEIAGGFIGKTSFSYLAEVQLDATLVNAVLVIVDQLVKLLYLDKIEESNLLNIGVPGVLQVKAAYDGNLLSVDLLGLKVAVGLSKKSTENQQESDVAIVTIGDSTIKLPCTSSGLTGDNKQNIRINLIKSNRTKVEGSTVTGTKFGYNVYGGGAARKQDGTSENGYSGGFVGYNVEGLLLENDMFYGDVVRGTAQKIGPFTGTSSLKSEYEFNTVENVEGENNLYRIYRKTETMLNQIKSQSGLILNSGYQTNDDYKNIYQINHITGVKKYDTLENAVMSDEKEDTETLNAYVSSAKAVLMDDSDSKTGNDSTTTTDSDTPEPSEVQDPCDEMIKLTINKVWKDHDNQDKLRPGAVTITLSRSWKIGDQEYTEVVAGYENHRLSGKITDNTWQMVTGELPAYTTVDGTKYYYTYSVTEADIEDYKTSIETTDHEHTFTITNSHFSILPNTGGKGIYIFIFWGAFIVGCMLYTGYKKQKKKRRTR